MLLNSHRSRSAVWLSFAVASIFFYLFNNSVRAIDMGGGTSLDAVVSSIQQEKNAAPALAPGFIPCKPGPWGNVSYRYLYLEAPEELVEHFPMPSSVPKWSFPGWTHEQVAALFDKAGLDLKFKDALLASGHVLDEDNILTVFPPLDALEAMSAEQRGMIYAQLAQYEQNEFHKDPVLITSGDVDEWLKGSSLRSAFKDKIKAFIYKCGDVPALSDLRALLNYTQSDAEAHDFFRLITRIRTLNAILTLHDASDLKALTAYWTRNSTVNREVLPMLESIATSGDVMRIGLMHLLPALARKNLFTYPPPNIAILGRIPDCHWTSLNFFNYYPKDYYLNTRLAADHVVQNYDKVSAPYEFGDVLMFLDEKTGLALHSCVVIADDIVFTKNGDNLVTPWVLMKLDEVKLTYFHKLEGAIQGYRLKVASK